MKKEEVDTLQVGDTVYFTESTSQYTCKAVICYDHLPERLRKGYRAVKVIEPFEKNYARINIRKLFKSREAAEVAKRMKR